MLTLLEKMTLRYGVFASTVVMVLIAIFTATLFDYVYYAMIVVNGIILMCISVSIPIQKCRMVFARNVRMRIE